MKTIEKLTITITYTVGLGDIKVPDNVYEELMEAYDNNDTIDPDLIKTLKSYSNANDWIIDNIKERDCYNWECEIDNIETEE